MTSETDEKLEKRIKKNIYGKPQSVKAIFPPGLGSMAFDEIQSILNDLWFPQKFISQCSLSKNDVRIHSIHLFSITELLMRSFCLSDIRLIIFEGKSFGKNVFERQCRDIPWDFYLAKNMSVKIKVDSVISNAFHEAGLKDIVSEIVRPYINEVVSGENTDETTSIFAELYKNRLTVSISLAGNSLYKRGYRGKLSRSAPLREDAAACCIQQSLQFARQFDVKFAPDLVLIPFSGTGTFAFEYLQQYYHFSPALFDRVYALQAMPLFRSEHFNYLLKKANEHCLLNLAHAGKSKPFHVLCIDQASDANIALAENLDNFKNAVKQNSFILPTDLSINTLQEDFLEMDIAKFQIEGKKLFLPLNPPYGIRLGNNADTVNLYQNIAIKINEISKICQKGHKSILGFILCPNEETWLTFMKNLKNSKTDTYHFTQGGIDIRVCQFYL